MSNFTWEEHVLTGQELAFIVAYLKKLRERLYESYGPQFANDLNNALDNLYSLQQHLGKQLVDEKPPNAKNISYVYDNCLPVSDFIPLRTFVVPLSEKPK
jgi:hypothetical protein